MPIDLADPGPDVLAFLRERHLATLSTTRPDGRLHVVAIAFSFDPTARIVRVISGGRSQKVRNVVAAGATGRAAVCQVDGARWLSLEGPARVLADASVVAEAEQAYAQRYQAPRPNPQRVVLEIVVERTLGRP